MKTLTYKLEQELIAKGHKDVLCDYMREPEYSEAKQIVRGTCALDGKECYGRLPLLVQDCERYRLLIKENKLYDGKTR